MTAANDDGPIAAPDIVTLRQDLAAAFRIAEYFDLHEGICNHFSVAVPGPQERYLINPYGLHWSEMRPQDLLLMDGDGTILEGDGEAEATARNIHIAGHRANPRHLCILHTHMPYATALTMIEGGRLEMAHQTACRFWNRTAYDDHFGGLALDAAEGERIAAAGGADRTGADITFLANHGVIVGASSVATAVDDLYFLERACRQQVLAMSTGRPLKMIPPREIEETARQWMQVLDFQAQEHFDALKRVIGL